MVTRHSEERITRLLVIYNVFSLRISPLRSLPSPPMVAEKEQTKVDLTTPDHATIGKSGDIIDEKKLLRKLDWHLVPGLTLLFLLSFLDRSNGNSFLCSPHLPFAHLLSVGNARIEGLATDLNMSMFRPR